MTGHTPGPWAVGYGAAYTAGPSGEVDDESIRLLLADRSVPETRPTDRDANIRRAVQCVNACEGIEDPAAALAEVRRVLSNIAARTSRGKDAVIDANYAIGLLTPKASR